MAIRIAVCIVAGIVVSAGARAIRADEKPARNSGSAAPAFEETWQVIYIGKSRVGYARSSTERKKRDGQELVVTDSEMTMAISRFGQTVKTRAVTRTEETPDGDLLELRFELQNPPAAPMRSVGRVKGDKLILETETNGQTKTKELPRDRTVKSPAYQDRVLRDMPLKPGEKRTFKMFDPQFAKVSSVTCEAGALKDVKLLDGKSKKLLEVTVSASIAPQIVTQEYLDDKGTALKSIVSLLQMTTYTVPKAEALKELSGGEVDLAVSTLVKTEEIERPRETTQVVYRLTTPGEDPEKLLVVGGTQAIRRVSPDAIDLTVTAASPPESAAGQKDPGKEFLAPNSYIQSDDPLVRKHAEAAAGNERDPWKAAQLMEHWVAENLKKKNFSTLLASAAEVAKDLSGDCTEHAVLLAAMCRARGIPARVAVGLVYVPSLSSFGGHMWTEVFVGGTWIPLDATLGKGGIAADHIKFADSSFADEGESAPLTAFLPMVSILGKLKIDVRDVKHGP